MGVRVSLAHFRAHPKGTNCFSKFIQKNFWAFTDCKKIFAWCTKIAHHQLLLHQKKAEASKAIDGFHFRVNQFFRQNCRLDIRCTIGHWSMFAKIIFWFNDYLRTRNLPKFWNGQNWQGWAVHVFRLQQYKCPQSLKYLLNQKMVEINIDQ